MKLSTGRAMVGAVLAGLGATLLFAAYTHLAWDDWYITFRASKNLALGEGLTFTPGERVHSFTSPLGTLIPALLSWIFGPERDDAVLWTYRGLSGLTLGGAAALLVLLGRRWGLAAWLAAAMAAVALLDAKVLANAANGMETAFLVAFLALAVLAHELRERRWRILLLGVAWAGLMWSRPDGFVYVAALCAGQFLFRPLGREGGSRVAMIGDYAVAGAIAALLYGPWIVWAWSYYGSFVPHTIIAKGLAKAAHPDAAALATQVAGHFIGRASSWYATFAPPYGATFRGWPPLLFTISAIVSWLCAMVWVVPRLWAVTRSLSFAATLAHLYLNFGMEFAFPWYYPPVVMLTACVLGLLLAQLHGAEGVAPTVRYGAVAAKTLAVLSAAAVITVTCAAAVQLRNFQSLVYEGTYRPAALWLRDHAGPGDSVFLEPLGYIGFFSGLKMLDYPGLSSKEVVAARRRFTVSDLGDRAIFADLIPYLKPDWLVLRPREIAIITRKAPRLLSQDYSPVRTFDVSRRIADTPGLPGRPWFELDQTFVIYRRAGAAPLPTPQAPALRP